MTKRKPRDTAPPDTAEPAPPPLPAGARFPRPSEPLGPPTPEQAATWRASNPKAWADMTAGHWARFLRERDSPGFNYWTDSAGMDALLAAGLLPEGWSIPRDFKTRVLSLHREPGFPEGPDWAPIHAWLGRYLREDPERRENLFVLPVSANAKGKAKRPTKSERVRLLAVEIVKVAATRAKTGTGKRARVPTDRLTEEVRRFVDEAGGVRHSTIWREIIEPAPDPFGWDNRKAFRTWAGPGQNGPELCQRVNEMLARRAFMSWDRSEDSGL